MELEDGLMLASIQRTTQENSARSISLLPSIEKILADSQDNEPLRSPFLLLKESWQKNQELGSSTLVVVTLPTDGAKIYSSYIGDSGYCILRETRSSVYEVVFQSKSQQRRFNFPYQLGWEQNGDHPESALNLSHDVKHQDIVVLGTDGVLDNLDPKSVDLVHLRFALLLLVS